MTSAYYNERDPYAAAWLRALIAEGLIADGEVDERDIRDVDAADLAGFRQHHFFAGIGGWSAALRLAGWPDDRPVWTGSCPCQPFSAAGKGGGTGDDRHLWPAWFSLIRQCRPPIVFGEQVDAAVRFGWLDLVSTDLESCGYAFGAAVLPAGGVEAPHVRSRLWFVADATSGDQRRIWQPAESRERVGRAPIEPDRQRAAGDLGDANGRRREAWRPAAPSARYGDPVVADGGLGDAASEGREGLEDGNGSLQPQLEATQRANGHAGAWSDLGWIWCRDGKYRPAQPGLFPLAHGVSGRVAVVRAGEGAEEETRWVSRTGALRGAGNAIVPQVAAEFIGVYLAARAA